VGAGEGTGVTEAAFVEVAGAVADESARERKGEMTTSVKAITKMRGDEEVRVSIRVKIGYLLRF
jgi:hypothetical protein